MEKDIQHSPAWKDSEKLALHRIEQIKGRNEPDDYKMYICKVDRKYKKAIWDSQMKKYWESQLQKELPL